MPVNPRWTEPLPPTPDVASTPIVVATPTDLFERRLPVPAILRLGDGALRWSVADGWREGERAAGVLARFLALADDVDADILAFAERYGVLGVMPDGRPGTSTGTFPPTEGGLHVEPLDLWRAYAWHARDVLTLTIALRDAPRFLDLRGDLRGFFAGGSGSPPAVPATWVRRERLVSNLIDKPLGDQRAWLAAYVGGTWLRWGGVAPHLNWRRDEPRVELTLTDWTVLPGVSAWPSNALFGVLSASLVATMANSRRLTRCEGEGCGVPVEGKRAPRPDQKRYCKPCGAKVRRKANQDSWRKRHSRKSADTV